ncbi:hypothetical protein SeLEV6574_g03209 [Synchytrium endobioticum]|nr:hypothetical protein SeLEV6574_g03209 [Synchytrium endobioticum]
MHDPRSERTHVPLRIDTSREQLHSSVHHQAPSKRSRKLKPPLSASHRLHHTSSCAHVPDSPESPSTLDQPAASPRTAPTRRFIVSETDDSRRYADELLSRGPTRTAREASQNRLARKGRHVPIDSYTSEPSAAEAGSLPTRLKSLKIIHASWPQTPDDSSYRTRDSSVHDEDSIREPVFKSRSKEAQSDAISIKSPLADDYVTIPRQDIISPRQPRSRSNSDGRYRPGGHPDTNSNADISDPDQMGDISDGESSLDIQVSAHHEPAERDVQVVFVQEDKRFRKILGPYPPHSLTREHDRHDPQSQVYAFMSETSSLLHQIHHTFIGLYAGSCLIPLTMITTPLSPAHMPAFASVAAVLNKVLHALGFLAAVGSVTACLHASDNALGDGLVTWMRSIARAWKNGSLEFKVEICAAIAMLLSYLFTLLITPLEDELSYTYTATSSVPDLFVAQSWMVFVAARSTCAVLGYLLSSASVWIRGKVDARWICQRDVPRTRDWKRPEVGKRQVDDLYRSLGALKPAMKRIDASKMNLAGGNLKSQLELAEAARSVRSSYM